MDISICPPGDRLSAAAKAKSRGLHQAHQPQYSAGRRPTICTSAEVDPAHGSATSLRLEIIPLELDSSPGQRRWAEASVGEVSAEGLRFRLQNAAPLSSHAVVVGHCGKNGVRAFATLSINSQKVDDGRLQVCGSWACGSVDDLFAAKHLQPRLDPRQLKFRYELPEAILQRWEELGVLRRTMVDRVMLCHGCLALPSWRLGCHVCGSGNIARQTPQGGESFRCGCCQAQQGHTVMAAMCHFCHRRFGVEDAVEQPLYAYRTQPLAPLRLAASPAVPASH